MHVGQTEKVVLKWTSLNWAVFCVARSGSQARWDIAFGLRPRPCTPIAHPTGCEDPLLDVEGKLATASETPCKSGQKLTKCKRYGIIILSNGVEKMSTVPDTIHPTTLAQIEENIVSWFGKVSSGSKPPISFSSHPDLSNQLRFLSRPNADFIVGTDHRTIFLEFKRHKLSVELDHFDVRTEFEGKIICFSIKPHPKPEFRFLERAMQQVAETKHPAFVSRLLRFVKNLEMDLPSAKIEEATASATDYLVFLNALSGSPLASESVNDDPLAEAKQRGLERKQQLIEAAGGVVSSEDASKMLSLTRQAVDKRRAQNQLIALTQGRRGYSYPSFQFEDGKTLHGLEETLREWKSFDPWMQLAFFVNPNNRLGGESPANALRAGRSSEVLRAARSYGEQGAA